MPAKLYFHDAANALSGTFPTGEQSARTATQTATGANTLRTMNRTIGAAQVTVDVQFNTTINTAYTKFYRFFCSPPLASDQTVGGGNATLNVADSHDASSQNHWIDGINLYVWRPSTGALVGKIKDAVNLGGSEPTANDSIQVTHITGITTSAVNGLAGDVIICEIWAETFVEANRSNANHRFYYDGTTENTTENAVVSNHASYIELAEDLVFEGEGGGKGFPFQPPMRGFIHMLVR